MINLNLHTTHGVRKVTIPECWDELTGEQMISIAAILFAEDGDDDDGGYRRDVRIIRLLCDLNRGWLSDISTEVVALELLPLFGWVMEACDRTEAFMPPLKIGGETFYGPAGKLANLRFTEFDFAERALYNWHQDPDDADLLYAFVATIFRPGTPGYDAATDIEGDARESFNANLSAKYAVALRAQMRRATALAVVLWYKGCRAHIVKLFPAVFGTEGGDSEVAEQPGYYSLIRSIAKQGIYGTFADVEQLYLYNALMELEAAADERARMEEAIEEAKRNSHAA